MTYIYVIGPKEGFQKIGYSETPEKRLKSLQTGHPELLYIHHTIEVNKLKAKLIEKLIHRNINHKRTKGEWFNLTIDEAKSEIDFALITYSENPQLKYL